MMATDFGDCVSACPLCNGVGLVPAQEGWQVCPNNPRRFWQTGVTERDHELWRVLPETGMVKSMKSALTTLLKTKTGLIYLQGTPGIGKSVCARAYTAEAVNAGIRAIYTRQSELVNYLRSSYDTEYGQEEYQARLRKFKSVSWLVIDEIGRDRMTDFGQESLAEIIDARYIAAIRHDSATVLVSNFAPEEVFQSYVVDRIRDVKNTVLSLKGGSQRANNNTK